MYCILIQLLDDGSGKDPLEVYNFGEAANYLFRPCQNEDGSPDEECDIRYMSDAFSSTDAISRPSVKDIQSLEEIKSGAYGEPVSMGSAPNK